MKEVKFVPTNYGRGYDLYRDIKTRVYLDQKVRIVGLDNRTYIELNKEFLCESDSNLSYWDNIDNFFSNYYSWFKVESHNE